MATKNTSLPGGASVVRVLRLSEERAAQGYLAARKAMVATGARSLSLGRLAVEHPGRAEYRAAWLAARAEHSAALTRVETAHARWLATQRRTDSAWTESVGRRAA